MMSEAINPKLTAQISLPRGGTLKLTDLMTSPIREFFTASVGTFQGWPPPRGRQARRTAGNGGELPRVAGVENAETS
jgi:hypothetical protein